MFTQELYGLFVGRDHDSGLSDKVLATFSEKHIADELLRHLETIRRDLDIEKAIIRIHDIEIEIPLDAFEEIRGFYLAKIPLISPTQFLRE